MKKLFLFCLVVCLVAFTAPMAFAQETCLTIQDGGLLDSKGMPITLGFDEFGYNYEAHMFNGLYCAYDRDDSDCPDSNGELIMKWNDAWLSSKSCDGNLFLDRHYGYGSYIGSGAWLTNHQSGWVTVGTKQKKWTYFCKIVAVPADANKVGGIWYAADGTEIGPDIWGSLPLSKKYTMTRPLAHTVFSTKARPALVSANSVRTKTSTP